MQMSVIFANDRTFTQPVVWVTAFVIVAFHVGAVAALFFFAFAAVDFWFPKMLKKKWEDAMAQQRRDEGGAAKG